MENISNTILNKVCLGCKGNFQTYTIDKVFCTESCRKVTNAGNARKRNKQGRFY